MKKADFEAEIQISKMNLSSWNILAYNQGEEVKSAVKLVPFHRAVEHWYDS